MYLTEQHLISKNHPQWKRCDEICFLSKNLYNSVLYYVKQKFIETGKVTRFNEVYHHFSDSKQQDWVALGSSAQKVLMTFDANIKTYFTLLKKWKKNKKSLSGCPKFPKYKDKTKGRNMMYFTNIRLKDGYAITPKMIGIKIKTNITDLKSVKQFRIVPRNGCYIIEIVYEFIEKKYINNNKYLSIDLGVKNLATCFDSSSQTSFIINGNPLKSINQYSNKLISKTQSELKKSNDLNTSKKLNRIFFKRNNKIKDYLHKVSRIVVDYCVKNNISNIVIGLNKEWKQEVNLGDKNNQNFVYIPFDKLIQMIKYKGQKVGINVTTHEESYTSKCSSLDLETLSYKETYNGKRIKRGLYVSKNGIKINADLNGAINVLRKETGDKLVQLKTLTSRGQVMWPVKACFN